MNNISFYSNVKDTKGTTQTTFDLFINGIQSGMWQDVVLPIRVMKTKEEQREAKQLVPLVTISGIFDGRADKGIISHSGLIAADIDNIDDPEEVKARLKDDPYILACFTSISGRGLCAIFKIDPQRHKDAYAGIGAYLSDNYKIPIDAACSNLARARFVSYDPHLTFNNKALKFTIYPKKAVAKKIDRSVYTNTDFDLIISQIQQRNINLCDNYYEWIRIAYGFVHQFGEAGREYFHIVSYHSTKYDVKQCNWQYDICLKSNNSDKENIATIDAFYAYCRAAGIEVYSDKTKVIISAAANAKKGRRTVQDTINNLEKFEGIQPADSSAIVEQVFNSNISLSGDSEIEHIKQWLKHNYSLRKNLITRHIDNEGRILDEQYRNSIWCHAKIIFPKISIEDVGRVINSDFTPPYNPIREFFEQDHKLCGGYIEQLADTIATDNYNNARLFIKKWLVSAVASVYGNPSRLMLILAGEQRTGKTEWLRRLLPDELKQYSGEISEGIKDNDLNIAMTQKFILIDDEFQAKTKREEAALKALLSKKIFTLREPYGRCNVDLPRLATFCGTSNDTDLLTDPTGNTRFIPIKVVTINHAYYNSINKNLLWIEAYQLYKSGFDYELSNEDCRILNETSKGFESYSVEYELIIKYCRQPPTENENEELTATDIKVKLEGATLQKLSVVRLGKELTRLGFKQKQTKRNGKEVRIYTIMTLTHVSVSTEKSVSSQHFDF